MRAKARDVSSVHYNSIKHARDVCTRTLSSYNELELTNHSAHLLGHFIMIPNPSFKCDAFQQQPTTYLMSERPG